VLTAISGTEKHKITEVWRKIHNGSFIICKVKCKFALTEHDTMKAYWGVEV
jgi:hypothetical protein